MTVTLVTLLLVSWITRRLYEMGRLPDPLDVFADRSMEVTALPKKTRGGHSQNGIDNPALDEANGRVKPMEMEKF